MALWFSEQASDGHRLEWKIQKMLYSGQSPYQTIEVLDTEAFGPSLVLDGIMQTTTGDEFIYHEMLAWVPLATHPHPERVLIIGGGDGGLARDVLRSPDVKEVHLVEIDPLVVEVSRTYLHRHVAAFDDPRLSLITADGMEYLKRPDIPAYDVILVDSTDPEGTGPGAVLYTPAFHQRVFSALAPDGLYVQQTGTPIYNPEVLKEASHSVAEIFPLCRVYWCSVPTYPGGFFTFTSGSKVHDLARPSRTASMPQGEWYTPEIHRAAFALPPMIERLIPPSARLSSASGANV
ncbi:polyamine aminopropyltransferase [Sulfobacillus harzensis]|uniref:Polyamine aminopropyltransferase n=1 Tax=Sulfobacillus harzensis TaxID=2729629 RepID=A0A7Y0L0R7_9FIRM|nr:polyamine aminopropyltransferase [Sulfobacillus harzensis]NMP21115.1 polyamine aminopropyltransferase [Sulfobacillus harzensis]